ncbi:hypothetical protein BB559_000889 [Furculomyces boomerangus]|uniref:Sorting nexin-4 n=2 Tax=Furculomyces boomerangus TaxID=61424 RepID=A0A2T9Z3N5_9FUNG|nr:hypothetical protein BB559_000889 [Furculomyces boomerangus]
MLDSDYDNVPWETESNVDSQGEQNTHFTQVKMSPEIGSPVEHPQPEQIRNSSEVRRISSSNYDSHQSSYLPSGKGESSNTKKSPSIPINPHSLNVLIEMSEPRKEGEGSSNPYISYLITTTKENMDTNVVTKFKRRRRYRDFVWLHENMVSNYLSVAVPPLPGKHRLGTNNENMLIEYFSGDRFGPDLERFVTRVALHPVLKHSPYFQTFTEAKDWSSQYEERPKKESSVLEGISDTLLNTFAKVKGKDETFQQMVESIARVEENVIRALKVVNKVLKNQNDLEKLYKDLSLGWNDLASIETGLAPILISTSNTINSNSSALQELSDRIERHFAGELEEHLAYCQVFKGLLKTRDGKQIEYEELCEYYKVTDAEMNRLVNYQSASGVSLVTNFIKGKVRDLRGIDPSISRQVRISSLKKRCTELGEAIESSKSELDRFNDDVKVEFEYFNGIKENDLKRCLMILSDTYIEYFEKSNQLWGQLLPELDNLKIDT